jgi:cell shape-determining protein MreC
VDIKKARRHQALKDNMKTKYDGYFEDIQSADKQLAEIMKLVDENRELQTELYKAKTDLNHYRIAYSELCAARSGLCWN